MSKLFEDTIKTFGKSKVEMRFNTLYQEMDMFIINNGFSEFLIVNSDLLAMAVHDYFINIDEIRQFHSIQHVDEQKIVSCTAYWLLCRKPIQIYNESEQYANKFATINERFVLLYILDYLSDQLGNDHILLQLQTNKRIKTMIDMLFQLLINGLQSVQSLQLVLESFLIYLHC
jgi:hypothetical protein